ncbi:MAG TPA: hypothetical protein VHB25_09025 [Gemmatimonadaceae bacterium]|nr:hypothetical protein [Gemmatimonadaceae bacterium]
MDGTLHDALSRWGNFYLTTGAAAATLTGLMFVVQSLLTSRTGPTHDADPAGGISAFGTPTVVHFTLALVISGVLSAPWPTYLGLREALGVLGAGALIYSGVVLRRARQQQSYVPTAYDWFWHIAFPGAAYLAVVSGAATLHAGTVAPLFVIAAATLLLLCVGIHNAWDTVTYLIVNAARRDAGDD